MQVHSRVGQCETRCSGTPARAPNRLLCPQGVAGVGACSSFHLEACTGDEEMHADKDTQERRAQGKHSGGSGEKVLLEGSRKDKRRRRRRALELAGLGPGGRVGSGKLSRKRRWYKQREARSGSPGAPDTA